jgi:flagellar operon protein
MDLGKVSGPGPRIDGADELVRKPLDPAARKAAEGTGKSQTFADFLGEKLVDKPAAKPQLGDLKFSAHAQTRLQSRGIELSPDELLRMKEAVQKASDKGSKESLILTDKAAFVVSVKNNTVITAVDRSAMKDNVFTNIDSTILI